MPRSAQLRSFVENAVEWHRTGTQDALLRLIRSRLSGVPHDVAAAYALIASRTGDLLDAIDRGRLVLPPPERDCVLHFAQRMRRVRAMESSGDALRSGIAQIFELPSYFDEASPERSRGAEHDTGSAQHDSAIELADAVAPEPQRGVQPWQRHFSASALNTYAECQRKWFYKYACAAIEDPGSSASAYGTAFHLALEDFHGEFPRPARRDEAAMRARIRECITWAFERTREGFPTPVEFKLQVRRAHRTAQRYVDWLLEQETQAPFEVLGREVAIELDLEGRPFVGYIDRLDRDERSGGVAVVDYKTGGIARTAAEYCDKVRRFREFQLPFYYWAQTAAGDRVTKLVLIPLKEALLDVRPIVLDVADTAAPARENGGTRGTIRIEELKRSRGRMSQLSDDLSSGKVQHFEPTNDPSACGYCSYATACVHRPPAEGRRFGS